MASAFDLTREPPIRSTLIDAAPDHAILILTLHHVSYDGRCKAIVRADLARAYRARLSGHHAVPPPTLQLSDVMAWQHERAEYAEEHLDYWRSVCCDTRRVEPQSCYRKGHMTFAVPVDERLDAAAAEAAVTVQALLATCFLHVIHRSDPESEDRLAVVVQLDNREWDESADVVATLSNMVPIAVPRSALGAIDVAAPTVHEALRNAYQHQELPSGDGVHAARRHPGRLPPLRVRHPRTGGSLAARPGGRLAGEVRTGERRRGRSVVVRRRARAAPRAWHARGQVDLLRGPCRCRARGPTHRRFQAIGGAGGPGTQRGAGMTVEEAITRIWCDVLGVQRVATDADLLDLGGDEVTAGWIAGRIRRAYPACSVTGRDVLVDAPTVSRLAALVDASHPPLEISSQQEALLARSRIARVRGVPMRPFTVGAAVEINGRPNVEALRLALAQIVVRHPSLRTSYRLDGSWKVVLNDDVPAFALPVVDLRALPAAHRDAAVTAQLVGAANTVFHPDDLVRLRAQLLRTGDDRYVLGLVLDHLVADGSSIDVLYRELRAGYDANIAAEPGKSTSPTYAFFDFVAEQRRWSRSAEYAAEVEFWRDTLGADGVHGDMPLPFERAVDADADAATVAHTIGTSLPAETVAQLDAAARQTRSTRFRVVLAALSVVLNRVTGRGTVTIASPDANRNHPGAADAIGWYAHVVLYRCDLSGDPDLDEVMDRVRLTFTQAQAHKHLPYRDLTRALSPDTFGLPRTATWVSLVAVDTPVLELTGLRCRPRNIPADAPNRALEIEFEDHHDGAVDLRINFDAHRFAESAVAGLFDQAAACGGPARRGSLDPALRAAVGVGVRLRRTRAVAVPVSGQPSTIVPSGRGLDWSFGG